MYKNKKILAIIPARGGSKGIKLKNLKTINKIPLVVIAGNFSKKIKFIDQTIVSTDNKSIKRICEKNNLEVPFYRPKFLSGDRVSDIAVIYNVLKAAEKLYRTKYDIILLLQPTSPLRQRIHITTAIKKLVNEKLDAVWSVSKTDTKNHPLKQLNIKNNRLIFYDKKGKDIIARQQLRNTYQRNGIVYALNRSCVLNQKKLMGNKTGALLIKSPSISIDTQFDIKLCELIINKKISF